MKNVIKTGIKKKSEKIKLFNFSDTAEEKALLDSGMSISIYGNTQALVDGCRGVIEYDSESVKLNCGKGIVTFTGESLKITSLINGSVSVYGKINNIEFCM